VFVYLVQGFGYGFAAAVQPGPFQTYIISQSLNSGWRRTLPAAFAPLVSDGPIIALVLLVLSQVPDWFQRILYIAGGLFILYLALNAFRGWRSYASSAGLSDHPGGHRSLLRAALMNLLSPSPYIFWSLVMGPILLAGWRQAPANGISLLLGFYLAMILSVGGMITLFSTARHLGPRVNRILLGISAIALLCFGLYQLWRGIFGG
jgi:threonine/homoserine/homoserine lactone efflux protein